MKLLYKILSALILVIVPVFLLITAVRVLIAPWYLTFEYNKASFPADEFGFTTQDRLKWGGISVEYLLNSAPINFLADQRLPDGTSLYNERELSHMLDVKNLVQASFKAWWILLAALIAAGIWAWRGGWRTHYWLGVSRGGFVLAGLIIAVLIATLTAFEPLFASFHHIFFTGDTWLFEYSDSLIRLFPEVFWQDAFILMGGFCLITGLAAGFLGSRLARRS